MQRLSCIGWVALIAVFTSQIAVSGTALSAEIAIAAASDLNFAIKDIIAEYEKSTGNHVKLSLGSSGNFYAQIQNGAPFDLYFSADIGYPKKLESGLTVLAHHRYAVGHVIWTAPGSRSMWRKGSIR
jgi:molybdate transport system substrate-binding protein